MGGWQAAAAAAPPSGSVSATVQVRDLGGPTRCSTWRRCRAKRSRVEACSASGSSTPAHTAKPCWPPHSFSSLQPASWHQRRGVRGRGGVRKAMQSSRATHGSPWQLRGAGGRRRLAAPPSAAEPPPCRPARRCHSRCDPPPPHPPLFETLQSEGWQQGSRWRAPCSCSPVPLPLAAAAGRAMGAGRASYAAGAGSAPDAAAAVCCSPCWNSNCLRGFQHSWPSALRILQGKEGQARLVGSAAGCQVQLAAAASGTAPDRGQNGGSARWQRTCPPARCRSHGSGRSGRQAGVGAACAWVWRASV